ncbi:aldehyde dehydrogenase family protein [Nocardioides marmorisolisilvae]|uniref:Aldehyde dehydrogenase n=1 Tax=Nocardioides marmorisolisilvae TaxID=1542737 RepID=A0A3N0DU09_9ACTN|nr:aldehyde dehydrogenase family protein [Nocardioides marmorisolisilvae]RNL79102.1 aldehyde dehydrogenase family protein [Nocardioides marmorisolisilvae]
MTITEPNPTAAASTFDSLNPRTGEVVATHPIAGEADVRAAVARAREASAWWGALSYSERADRLGSWKALITQRLDELAGVMSAETGKPHGDALLEAALAIDHLAWASKHAGKVLKRHKVPSGLVMANQKATVEFRPLGVIGVIGPWNYPVFTPMGSIAYALAAGNAVVFKPSEYTPGIGQWLAATFAEVIDQPVFQVVTGLGETGAALCRSGVDKLAFTGSTATGKKVMAACAESLTPVLIEAGGKDALIVDEDADLDAAADGAVWGACGNAGQTCAGVERVYVHERVYDEFLEKITAKAKALEASDTAGSPIGPITMPSQIDIIRRHIDDALAKGGRAVVGGSGAVGERFVQPTILVDVPKESSAWTEETFGPTMTVAKVNSMDEAVALTNDSRYALGSAVFSKSRGMKIAERLRVGMTSINGVITFAGVPSLPFGGIGDSGFGRIHGPEGLKEFTYAHAITKQRMKPLLALTTFERTEKSEQTLGKMMKMLHGRGGKK